MEGEEAREAIDLRFFKPKKTLASHGGEYVKGDAYGLGLRQHVVQAYLDIEEEAEIGVVPWGTITRLSKQFKVSRKSVSRWVETYKNNRRLDPLIKGGRTIDYLPPDALAYVKALIERAPAVRLWEIQLYLLEDEGYLVTESSLQRILTNELDFSHKKVPVMPFDLEACSQFFCTPL